jgi:multidrug resistance protein MdtO
MSAVSHLPQRLIDSADFIREELLPFPGRMNVMLRCLLASAIAIVISMSLQVPFLALSLIIVFYVTQMNVVVTRLIGMMFIVGSTLAVAGALLLLKLTFDYPLLRILGASALFFGSVYLMRILKIGVVFFIVAIVIIYVQSFVDLTDQSELLVRLVLWVWVAVNYAVLLTLLINTFFLPIEPERQLKTALRRQVAAVVEQVAALLEQRPPRFFIDRRSIRQAALSVPKLMKFAAMRSEAFRENEAQELARIAAVFRLYRAASELPHQAHSLQPWSFDALTAIRTNCLQLDMAIAFDKPYKPLAAVPKESDGAGAASIGEMGRALAALAELDAPENMTRQPRKEEPMVAPDAFTNPVYVRFALKTLLTVLAAYTFYNAADWQGVHTIMLTCLIVALPGLGASSQKALLRIAGALVGSALALFMVVFVVPRIDGIIGLLSMSLPVIALGAWVSAGSERISYAGIQIVFTFALALLEQFGPTTNLTEIRDRMVGILLGVGIAAYIQMSIWPEAEGETLRTRIAGALRAIAALMPIDRTDPKSASAASESKTQFQAFSALADCESMLARVALEPSWQEGEHERVTIQAQTILTQSREILAATIAYQAQIRAGASQLSQLTSEQAKTVLSCAANMLETYAEGLAANPPAARRPLPLFEGPALAAWRSPAIEAANKSESDAPIGALTFAAEELDLQLRGLPEWGTRRDAALLELRH